MNENKTEDEKLQSGSRDSLSALPSLEASPEQDATTILPRLDSSAANEAATAPATEAVADVAHPAHHIVVPEVGDATDAVHAEPVPAQSEALVAPPVATPVAPPAIDDVPITSFTPETQAPSMGFEFSYNDEEQRKSRRRKVIIASTCVVVALLAGVYIYFGNYYTTHFLPNTTVNGDEVSGMSVEELSEYISNIGASYKTHVSGVGLNITIQSADIDFVYDGVAYGNEAGSQINAWSWPIELGRPHAYTVQKGISYNEDKLNEIVSAAIDKYNETATQPTNAGIRYDGDTNSFVSIPDAVGTAVQKDAILPLVSMGVSTMQDEITLGDELLVQPTIKEGSKKIKKTLKRMNKLINNPIKLTVQGNEVFTIEKSLSCAWVGVNDALDVIINHDAILQWAQGALSAQIDTKGTKRSYTRPDGKQITVEGGSPDYDYGWCLDGAALADTLTNNLNNAVFDTIELPMKSTGATWNPGGQDWPARYIDVDLSEQHVRMYDESSNVIWESDCVSGNPIYSGGTDTGVFFIYMKASPMELVGLDYDHDGQPDYRSWVTYWMPFDGGEGLHDMSSRGAFGGNIYSYNGSHGCVNLPYDKAEQLYGITNVGDPVIVHW